MSLLAKVQFIPRHFRFDERGWLLKVINGQEPALPAYTGEVYLVSAFPGQARGNHFHPKTSEWFTVVMGKAQMVLADPITGNQQSCFLSGDDPITVYVPAGVAHVFKNPEEATEMMLLAVYADQLYDPSDTVSYHLI